MTTLLLFKLCHVALAKAALAAVLFLLALMLAPTGVVALVRDWPGLSLREHGPLSDAEKTHFPKEERP